jgi:hypothetical protein
MDRLGPEVDRELRRFGPAAGMARLLEAWPEAVGPAIARSAWPARFSRDGTLVVHAADAVWAFELAQQARTIAARLGDLVPNGLSFVVGPLPEPCDTDADESRQAQRDLTPEEVARADAWAGFIASPDLREAAARAARASLARSAGETTSDRAF